MKYVVIGGAGFIGSHLTKLLVEKDHNVKVIDNLFRGKIKNLEDIQEKIEFKQLDILDFENMKNELKNVDGIFHQSALTSVPESFTKTNEYNQVNVVGTENIFKIAHEFDIKVVFASSASVYGNSPHVPIKEDFPRNPINPYGKTKLEDENLAEKYSKLGSKIIGLRYFNVFGKGQNLDYAGVITKFLERLKENKSPIIFGDGNQTRDFIFVKDVAEANLELLESNVEFGFFNVGSGIGISINELANTMMRLFNVNKEVIYDDLPEGDVRKSQADISLITSKTNWTPRTTIEEGLKQF